VKRLLICGLVVTLVSLLLSAARATEVSFNFDASDFMNVIPSGTGTSQTQENARRVRAYDSTGAQVAGLATWDPGADVAGYTTWANSLTAGQGIAEFSMWLVPKSSFGPAYNSILGYDVSGGGTWGANTTGQVTAGSGPDGWHFAVADYTGAGGHLMLPTWYTTDPTKYLRPGAADQGLWSFTANLAEFDTATGARTGDALEGKDYRLWFWSDSGSESLATTGLPTEIVVGGASSWPGVNDPNIGGGDQSEVDFRAISTVKAVPEPSSIALALAGLASLAWFGWRRRR
jgi:hypothetical protein